MEQLIPLGKGKENSPIVERIASAAILFNGETYTGWNHARAIRELEKVHPNWMSLSSEPVQEGFLTNTGRFIRDRKEATRIADRAAQLDHLDEDQKEETKEGLDSYHLRH